MRALPIFYLTLALICGLFVVGGIIGFGTLDQDGRTMMSEAGFFLSWLPIGIGVFSLLSLIFWIAGLIHCLTNKALEGNEKIVWILVVIFLNALGAVLYFFLAPNPASVNFGREQIGT